MDKNKLYATHNYCPWCELWIGNEDICPKCKTDYRYSMAPKKKKKISKVNDGLPAVGEVLRWVRKR